MLKKLLLIFALLLSFHLDMCAAYSLVVNRSDGSVDAFLLQDSPVMTFTLEDLNIACNENILAIPKNEIANIEFIDNFTGITAPEIAIGLVEFIDGTTLRFSGDLNAPIRVFDISGRVAPGVLVADGSDSVTTVSFENAPKGVYVITCNNKSFKFIKK